MSVQVVTYPPHRRLIRRLFQIWFLEKLASRLKRPAIQRAMRKYCADGETCALFRDVEIETVNRCNGKCAFCPVNASQDPRPLATMDDSLFSRILEELSGLRYHGRIGLSSNNEPFIDERIFDRIAQSREACPNARIYLYTNGTLLESDKVIRALRAGLDNMVIDDYGEGLTLSPNVCKIVETLNRPDHVWAASRVVVFIRDRDEILRNRAGRAPNKPTQKYQAFTYYAHAGCMNPFKQIIIRPTGQVSLCCNDTLGEVTLGNVGRDGLKAVWDGAEYRRVRRSLLRDGRCGLPLCESCDITCLGVAETLRLLCGC